MTDEHKPPTKIEQMIVTAARLIKNEQVLMVGTQWPIIASLLAKSLHAPDVTICFEGGIVIERLPDRIPLFTGDPISNSCSILMGSTFDTMGAVLHAGRADVALLSAASVDRFGNVNTTCIGDYCSPKIRFGGSGGACDFASLARRMVVIMEHDRRRFPEYVDFITTPGFLSGRSSRIKAGLRSETGPYAVVTTLGLFHFNNEGEMVLSAYSPLSTVDEVTQNVQWELKIAEAIRPLEPPNEQELHILRTQIDPHGMYLNNARSLECQEVIDI